MPETLITQLHESAIMYCTLILGAVMLLFTRMQGRTDKSQNRRFIRLVLLIMFNSLTEAVKILALPYFPVSVAARYTVHVMQLLYFASHTMLSPLLFFYVEVASGVSGRRDEIANRRINTLFALPLVLIVFLVFLNPMTHFVYMLDPAGNVMRRGGEFLIYAVAMLYFLMAAGTLLINWRSIGRNKKATIITFFGVSLAGMLIQLLNSRLRSELFAEMLGLAGLMLMVENEDDRIDISTRVYNRTALVADMNTSIKILGSFDAVCVRIINADTVHRILGNTDSDSLVTLAAEYLKTVHDKQYIYRATPDSFMLIFGHAQENTLEKAEEIYRRFSGPFEFLDTHIMLEAVVMCAAVPDDLERREDIMLMCDGPLPTRDRDHVLKGAELDYLVRRAEVESALHRGLTEKRFEVYYQPVYRTNGMSIYSAEALLRLKDSKIGNITPDEFIPIAEQSGLIDRLGDYVIEEVCLFLSSGIPTEMGLDCIEVNLSVLQCLQPDFTKRVMSIVRKYDIQPRFINFEVTESAAASDYKTLGKVLAELKSKGFRLALDDYGIGYSNVRSVFSLDFDVVKIDKSILWEVKTVGEDEEKDKGFVILENSIRMIREMDLKILVEGVETQEQMELLENMDVDYLQGFYFSRPVSKNELLGILRVTELARMEEQRARAASDAKSNFLANMSHEIRTPINAILGMNEMILRESKNKQILEYAGNIEGAGKTLISLINDILDFSKIESGSMEIVESEYDLSSVINDVVNMIQIKANEKGLDFRIRVNPDLPDNLYGDGMRFRQIMVNVLNNAVKYTKKGRVTMEVNGSPMGRDRMMLTVSVTDTGIGIKEEDISRLFLKFHRFDESINRNIEGSGLGLAITYSLLQMMHGEISCTSIYGEGSTFTIKLPQRVVKNVAIGDFRQKMMDSAGSRTAYRESFRAPDARILVVDDTAVNHLVIKELLKLTQIQIDTAMSGRECLEMIQNTRYDLIFLDFRMPEMDGIETLHIMKCMDGHPNIETPVVALTANAVTGARERFLSEGFDEYMIKPVDGAKLEEMLVRFLPEDKVMISHGAGEETEAAPEAEQEETDWLDELGDMDSAKGVANCGSAEGYRNVLRIYYDSIQKKSDEIEEYFDKNDWDNYTIQVHALKSSSRVIGATELSEWAAELEKAGNELNLDKIRSETSGLLAKYRSYGDILRKLFREEQEEAAAAVPGKEISEKELKEAYAAMGDFASMYDYDDMLIVFDSLKDYELPPEDAEKVKKIKEATEALKWEEVIELLKQ
ncbi:MAG: EAL domain-containing protein [Lachnospiraceae bacterium]|nr:EAL domain-containing protein [Lachnospiraceae bacterium]